MGFGLEEMVGNYNEFVDDEFYTRGLYMKMKKKVL